MGLRLVAVLEGCLRSSLDAATGRFFEIARLGHEKKAGQLRFPASKEEKPTLMAGSLGWSPVRRSVGGKAELAALVGPVLGKDLEISVDQRQLSY